MSSATLTDKIALTQGTSGTAFYDVLRPEALQKAQEYAGEKGYVASMPQLLHAMTLPSNSDNCKEWWMTHSEENIGTTRRGNNVVLTFHGCGIWTPKRLYDRTNCVPGIGYISSDDVFKDALRGRLTGSTVPVFSYKDFLRQRTLPLKYGVVSDLKIALQSISGKQKIDDLYEDPVFIVRAGGKKQVQEHLDFLKTIQDYVFSTHIFAASDSIRNKGVILSVSLGEINGWEFRSSEGRYIAVSKDDLPNQPESAKTPVQRLIAKIKKI